MNYFRRILFFAIKIFCSIYLYLYHAYTFPFYVYLLLFSCFSKIRKLASKLSIVSAAFEHGQCMRDVVVCKREEKRCV